MGQEFGLAMAGAASAHQAATATREDTSQQRAGRTRRTGADPQRAQQGATASPAAAPAALDSLSRLQQLADASPRVAQLQRLQALADASPQVAQLRRLQALADGRFAPVAQLAGDPEEEELVQGKFATVELQPQLQQAPRANNTGLPDQLKSGIESLSGLSLDDVRVYNKSAQPAQLNALAYAQGTDIHVAPGQEQHLPHEAWHVVQQAQGRVRPTLQAKGMAINDDQGLEHKADVMGAKAMHFKEISDSSDGSQNVVQARVVQRFVPFEDASINRRVVVTDALASDYGDTGLITRKSRNVGRTHIVKFDNEPHVEYRAKPEELEFEDKQIPKRGFAEFSKNISKDLSAPIALNTRKNANHLREYAKEEKVSEEQHNWSSIMKGKLWTPKGKEANLHGSSLATAHAEASALALVKASGYPITAWNPNGREEKEIVEKKGEKLKSKAPDFRIGNRIADAFRVTKVGSALDVCKDINNNVNRKREKYGSDLVFVAVLTEPIANVRELLKTALGMLKDNDILLIVIDKDVHHAGPSL